jgi:hypothetical protein
MGFCYSQMGINLTFPPNQPHTNTRENIKGNSPIPYVLLSIYFAIKSRHILHKPPFVCLAFSYLLAFALSINFILFFHSQLIYLLLLYLSKLDQKYFKIQNNLI